MKKILLLLPFLIFALGLRAQENQFGLKGGANYADINGSKLAKDSHRYKLGWHAGAFLYIPMSSPFFAIQPEILYSRKGYENDSPEQEIRDSQGKLLYVSKRSGRTRLNYIDVPVMFTFKSKLIIFEIGPQASVLVGVQDDSFLKQTHPDGTIMTPDYQQFKRGATTTFDLGLAAGFRLQTENGASVGLRFNQGLVNIRPSITDVPLPPDARNQVFQLYGGYVLPF